MNQATLLRWMTLPLATVALSGCATAAMPVDHLASSAAAIRSAQDTGASGTPAAALELHYAELERVEAQSLINNHHNGRAAMQLRRAEADANLAIALTREAAAAHALVATTDPSAAPVAGSGGAQ